MRSPKGEPTMDLPQMLDSGPILLIEGAVAREGGAKGKKPPRKELGVWLPLPGALISSLHLCSPGSWGFGNHPTSIYIGSH